MRVMVVHQHDPCTTHVGGIETFISTFVKYAPDDLEIRLVGVTTDPTKRPVGRWQTVRVGRREIDVFPVVAGYPRRRTRIPLSVRLTWGRARYRRHLDVEGTILAFHRVEPSLALRGLSNPKVLFLHVHPQDFYNPKTEVVWGRVPWAYFWLERKLIGEMARIYIVREDAVAYYRRRYPALADRIEFLPTWVDEEVFVSLREADRIAERHRLAQQHGFDPAHRLLLFVGRFEGQKDPRLLLEAFRRLNGFLAQSRLLMIGEGSLEPEIRAFLATHGLTRLVHLISPQSQFELARWMNIADCLILSSAYEGMPRVMLEALRCGLPVVATDVGETSRFIHGERVGRLVHERTPEALSQAIADVLSQPPDRQACQQRVLPYTARGVLARVYAAYRELDQGASR